MGIYYGEPIGSRILLSNKVVWEYEGPYWRELLASKRKEFVNADIIVETKHEATTTHNIPTQTMYVWLPLIA